MLLFKRLLTTLVLFVILFVVVFFGSLIIGGAVSGMQASRQNDARTFDAGYAVGQEAGREFAVKWTIPIRNISFGVALVAAAGLSFSGVLPWCRRRVLVPPPLPPGVE